MRNLLFLLIFVAVVMSVKALPVLDESVARQSQGYVDRDSESVLVVIDDADTVTVGEFKCEFIKNRIGTAQTMSPHDFFDEFLTFRLNLADAKQARIDTLPEYHLAVSTHMMSLVQPELPPHLAAMINSRNDDVVADIIAATDSVYNARADLRDAIIEFANFMLADYVIEDYLEKEGLNNSDSLRLFFEETRDDYCWDKPRFKGYVICLARSENPEQAEAIIKKTDGDMEKAIPMLRRAYGRNIRIGHVVMAHGTNDIVDYVAFGGDKNADVDRWSLCRSIGGRIIDAPETFEDVRGAVTDKLRKKLLERRYNSLRASHNVKINQNALKKIESLTGEGDVTSSAQNK